MSSRAIVEGPPPCDHAAAAHAIPATAAGCEECLAAGTRWVHLRECLTCGHVGCCDSSPNRHARHHHEEDGHHVVRSAEPGESWIYCFADERQLAARSESADDPGRTPTGAAG